MAGAGPGKMGRGTYIVVLKSDRRHTFDVGRLGQMLMRPGYYAYVGSAMGPGGIGARVWHHARISRKPHWHIDYLRANSAFYSAWALESTDKKECEWASILAGINDAGVAVKGFGASDCDCATHLFYLPSYARLEKIMGLLKLEYTGLVELGKPVQVVVSQHSHIL